MILVFVFHLSTIVTQRPVRTQKSGKLIQVEETIHCSRVALVDPLYKWELTHKHLFFFSTVYVCFSPPVENLQELRLDWL